MDKYEYNLKLDQIKSYSADGKDKEAAELADTINWNKVKNVNTLVKIGEIYEKVGRYEDSRDVLLNAYDHSPIGRTIIYRLAEVAIKMKDFDAAKEYYEEFVDIAPHDNQKYVLKYNILKASGAQVKELVSILEEFKEQEYTEEWAFELAYLYHKAGQVDKCIDACDELILWFGDGPFVEKALELKMLYQPLTKVQEEKYRKFRHTKEGKTIIDADVMMRAGEYVHDPVVIPQVTLNPSRFNTVNLQKEIAKGMQQIMEATEKETVEGTMDNIKKIVEEIPYLQLPKEEEPNSKQSHIETDEEIDGSLKINFKELLGEDSDGQISMVVNEKTALEKQITGQMTIAEVLEEWEKTRRAAETALQYAEQRKLESAKARALQEAEDIMERLSDVIPKIEAGITPKELLEEEYLQKKVETPEIEGIEEIKAALKTDEVDDILDDVNIEEIIIEDELHPEDTYEMEELAEIQTAIGSNSDLEIDKLEKIIQEYEAATEELEKDLSIVVKEEAAAIKEAIAATEEIIIPEAIVTEEAIAIPEAIAEEEKSTEDFIEETEFLEELEEEEVAKVKIAVETERIAEAGTDLYPHDELSEMEVISEEEELEISELVLDLLDDDTEISEEAPKRREIKRLTEEEKAILSYFVPVKGMESQIFDAIKGITRHLENDKTAIGGNVVIQGGQGCGKTALATSLVKVLQKECGKPNGKVGKIDAGALNKKDIKKLLKKVSGGCLIIEDVGALERKTAVALSLLLEHDTSGVLVIMEGSAADVKKALALDDGFGKKFTESITVPIFNNDELVTFAKCYANELGYEIDELAVLAVYNCISNIQRLDQATRLEEIKEIVDEAIRTEGRIGMRKFFRILTASRYNDDEQIILTEKDFQ